MYLNCFLYCYSMEWAYMAGSAGAGADGSGAGSEAWERTTSGQGSQRIGHRRGLSPCRTPRQGVKTNPSTSRGRALRVEGRGRHSWRRGEKISSFQNRPQHINNARNTSTPGTWRHELDQPVAAILKVSSASLSQR